MRMNRSQTINETVIFVVKAKKKKNSSKEEREEGHQGQANKRG
jgi:hypothetical protein